MQWSGGWFNWGDGRASCGTDWLRLLSCHKPVPLTEDFGVMRLVFCKKWIHRCDTSCLLQDWRSDLRAAPFLSSILSSVAKWWQKYIGSYFSLSWYAKPLVLPLQNTLKECNHIFLFQRNAAFLLLPYLFLNVIYCFLKSSQLATNHLR